MDRETKVIKTPNAGAEVKIKTYITGREIEEIDGILYRQLKVSSGTGATAVADLKASFLTEQTHKLIEIMVVEVNGKTDNILDAILDMRKKDYLFVLSEINKAAQGGDKEERKKKA